MRTTAGARARACAARNTADARATIARLEGSASRCVRVRTSRRAPISGAMRGVFDARELGVPTADVERAPRRRRGAREALIVVDVQNDFVPPSGALAVPGGEEIVRACSSACEGFERVILSQDYHCEGHSSFASSHSGRAPYDEVAFAYGTQTLWPDHCVQGTRGCAFHDELTIPSRAMVVRKGYSREVDSYSAFFENDKISDTGLDEYLRREGVERVFVVGLAYDFCVKYTALDAKKLGYEAIVVRDCCRGVGLPGTMELAEKELAEAGVVVIESFAAAPDAL